MYQVDNATAAPTMPAIGPAGPVTGGFFTSGNPSTGTPATVVDEDIANTLMMEIINAVIGSGQLPVKGALTQLMTAIKPQLTLTGSLTGANSASIVWFGFLILNLGNLTVAGGQTVELSYQTPFKNGALVCGAVAGGTGTTPSNNVEMNCRVAGSTLGNGQITNQNGFSQAFDWWVFGT